MWTDITMSQLAGSEKAGNSSDTKYINMIYSIVLEDEKSNALLSTSTQETTQEYSVFARWNDVKDQRFQTIGFSKELY